MVIEGTITVIGLIAHNRRMAWAKLVSSGKGGRSAIEGYEITDLPGRSNDYEDMLGKMFKQFTAEKIGTDIAVIDSPTLQWNGVFINHLVGAGFTVYRVLRSTNREGVSCHESICEGNDEFHQLFPGYDTKMRDPKIHESQTKDIVCQEMRFAVNEALNIIGIMREGSQSRRLKLIAEPVK